VREKPTGNYFFGGYCQRGKTHLLIAQYRWMLDRNLKPNSDISLLGSQFDLERD
jgi:hypothetical protein